MNALSRRAGTGARIELLEARIAPATLINPTTVTYQDVDGDEVTIKLSKPVFLDALTANALLRFSTGLIDGSNATPQQLERIDFGAHVVPAEAADTNISVSAKRSAQTGGDGFVNVGAILASGIDLGTVKIGGDLGRITAGDDADDLAVKGIVARSIGAFGLGTQGDGASSASALRGALGDLAVKGDIEAVSLTLTDITGSSGVAGIGSIKIGGSLRGGVGASSGAIFAQGPIRSITIGGNIFGDAGADSGRIETTLVGSTASAIGVVKIGGSIFGGDGARSGAIASSGDIKSAAVRHDVRGGEGDDSGSIISARTLGAVAIKGSLVGGGGEESGAVIGADLIKSVKIAGELRGGGGDESGYIHSVLTLGPVAVGGSVIGGAGTSSALIYAGSAISVPHLMKSITVGGDLRGGDGVGSASIGTVFGAQGNFADLDIGKVSIKGSLVGGAANSASITANDIGSISVGGSLVGTAAGTANIVASGVLKTAKIGGSIVGGATGSGGYLSAQELGAFSLRGDLRGGGGDLSGGIAVDLAGAKRIAIGGSVESGTGNGSGSINIDGPLGSLAIGGSVRGTADDPVRILARGTDSQTTPLAIGKLSIRGSATFLQVLGGYGAGGTQVRNADANLGAIIVGGDWVASSIAAGVDDGADNKFGTADDAIGTLGNDPENVSRIASITIKGQLRGTPAGVSATDGFGFVAQEIGKLKIGAVTYPAITVATPLVLGATGDFFAREVA